MKVKIYQTRIKKEWRWNLKGDNGKTIAASSEGFINKIDCLGNIRLTIQGLSDNLHTLMV